jgi:hypothetical protein
MRFRSLIRFLVVPALLLVGALAVHGLSEGVSVGEAQVCTLIPGISTCGENEPLTYTVTVTNIAALTSTATVGVCSDGAGRGCGLGWLALFTPSIVGLLILAVGTTVFLLRASIIPTACILSPWLTRAPPAIRGWV